MNAPSESHRQTPNPHVERSAGREARFKVGDLLHSQMPLMTSWTLSVVQQHKCAEFVARNRLPIDEMFSHRWRLDQIVEAYELFDKQSAGKGVVVFDEP